MCKLSVCVCLCVCVSCHSMLVHCKKRTTHPPVYSLCVCCLVAPSVLTQVDHLSNLGVDVAHRLGYDDFNESLCIKEIVHGGYL